MGNANWTFIIIKIMISVAFVMIIKMKDENDTQQTLYSLFAVNGDWEMNSILVYRDREIGGKWHVMTYEGLLCLNWRCLF